MASVCSSHSATSISLVKTECPYCKKELQTRAMGNHFRKIHEREFILSNKAKWIEEAENGEPLCIMWSYTNDFDEEEFKKIYFDLATNTSFLTLERAKAHFKKDKASLKEHNKQLKQLKKQYTALKKQIKTKEKKEKKQDPYLVRFQKAKASNDPELARALWRAINFHKEACEHGFTMCEFLNYHPNYAFESSVFRNGYMDKELVSYQSLKDKFALLESRYSQLLAQKCLDVSKLQFLWEQLTCFWTIFQNNMSDGNTIFRKWIDGHSQATIFLLAEPDWPGVDF